MTILSMQIPFVGFQPIQSGEHMAALGMFGLIQLIGLYNYLTVRSEQTYEAVKYLMRLVLSTTFILVLMIISLGHISPWTGRFYALLDPSYAKTHIPIIASVAEHQATSWGSFFNDFFLTLHLFPLGIFRCIFADAYCTLHARLFLLTLLCTSLYFSSIMVRLVLVLAPGMAILSANGLSGLFHALFNFQSKSSAKNRKAMSIAIIATCSLGSMMFCKHCIVVASQIYSNPSIVLSSRTSTGNLYIIDDFREAYWWLRQNTPEDAKIMSWWDYGYQLTSIANRTTLVDNNTWNNTHISRVGQAMSLPEHKSIHIIRELDVDYILVLFGGMIGFSGDDISKSYWMFKIGGSTDTGSDIKEEDYLSADGNIRIDQKSGKAFLDSLLYRMCFYNYDKVQIDAQLPLGYDRVRSQETAVKNITFDFIEEAYTTSHWIVRIFKVKSEGNRRPL